MATTSPPLPRHVHPISAPERWRVDDSLFYPSAHLFPESREAFAPLRSFPLQMPGYSPDDEHDESIAREIMGMGLQYSVFIQLHREAGLRVLAPASWAQTQCLWTDLPLFAEEPCEWHYPRVQVGYNVERVGAPELLEPDRNQPQKIGFLPNGDLVLYWELAEALADELALEIEAITASIDGRVLLATSGGAPQALRDAPVGQPCETGLLLERRERAQLIEATRHARAQGSLVERYLPNPSGPTFYRLNVPIFQCEAGLNRYLRTRWEEIGISFPRLTGFSFQIMDTPHTRDEAIFATEHGNLVASRRFITTLRERCHELDLHDQGELLPIARTP